MRYHVHMYYRRFKYICTCIHIHRSLNSHLCIDYTFSYTWEIARSLIHGRLHILLFIENYTFSYTPFYLLTNLYFNTYRSCLSLGTFQGPLGLKRLIKEKLKSGKMIMIGNFISTQLTSVLDLHETLILK